MQNVTARMLAIIGALIAIASIAPDHVAAQSAASSPSMTSLERVAATAKGELKSPLTVTPDIVTEGKNLYQAKTCGACHGGTGSGLHCPSLINDAWIYGDDDDTLFRLVVLGSEGVLSGGYTRGDTEKHAGPMPGFGETLSDEQEVWKIIAYIRSLKTGGAN
jgi:mono/diheme cytochrome c family protein